mmetsp:Transcript_70003/g.196167  ORF Transcript_70003/g.196167 Transcript_70003/m.196167 type:complete len:342 (-) Transcript_70003:243-1268(-)
MNAHNVIKKTNHNRWIARRKIKESSLQQTGSFSGIDLPNRQDVLIGKGKPIQDHVGNMKFRGIIEEHMAEYIETKRGEKAVVINKVLDAVLASSARFLAKDEQGWWNEVSSKEARDKVSKAFLTAGTRRNRSQNVAASAAAAASRAARSAPPSNLVPGAEGSTLASAASAATETAAARGKPFAAAASPCQPARHNLDRARSGANPELAPQGRCRMASRSGPRRARAPSPWANAGARTPPRRSRAPRVARRRRWWHGCRAPAKTWCSLRSCVTRGPCSRRPDGGRLRASSSSDSAQSWSGPASSWGAGRPHRRMSLNGCSTRECAAASTTCSTDRAARSCGP